MIVDLVGAFGKEREWVKYQIESYDNFIDFGLQKIINEVGTINVAQDKENLKIKFGKVSVGKPIVHEADGSTRTIYPNEARIRNLNYMAPISVKITPIFNGVQEKSENVHIGDLPAMVKSKICTLSELSDQELVASGEDPTDPGGYFVVNGTERVLVLIEEISSNKPIFEKTEGGGVTVRINSEKSGFKQRHLIEMKPDGEITISFANIKKLPIVVLLKALGIENDKELCDMVSREEKILNEFYTNLYETDVITTEEAVDFMGRKLKVSKDYIQERVNQILDRSMLPHLGQEVGDRLMKGKYLARIIMKCICVKLGVSPEDDIDHYANKRLLMSGELFEQLFRSIMLGRWGLIAKMTYNYQKLIKRGKFPSVQSIIEANTVTKQILSSLATGTWIGGRTGVSQRLDRSSYIKTISHLRSVLSPLTPTQEHFKARQVHPTEWGRLCPAETPEGSSIGLRKHLALLTEITPGLSKENEEEITNLLQGKVK
ncbi:MAG: DNA-directed RNA polymerase subunit B'' [Candidatus Aenigmatarchaeota archaeon]|nr:MAG: DNA-directed RNA polymerase subunit B'' [Candidatus Aenigmarchaeota archaeon]